MVKGILAAAMIMAMLGTGTTNALAQETEVVIGTHRDFTGPIAGPALRIWRAFDWHTEWLQKNDPIPGVKLKVIWEDTAYSAERYLPAYKRFKDAGAVLMINTSSTANSVLGELHRSDKIPCITPGCGYIYGFFPKDIKEKGPSYLFYDRPPYSDGFAGGAMYFLNQWKKAGHKGKPKAAFTGWDSPYPRGPIELDTPYLTEQGFEMLPPEIYAVTSTDLRSQAMSMKRAEANLIMSNVTEKFFAMLCKDAKRAGVKYGIGPDKTIILGGSEAPNMDVIKMAGGAAEGVWAVDSFSDFDRDDLKGIKLMKELQMEHMKKIEPHANYLMGMQYSTLIWGIFKKVIEKYGKGNITSANIYTVLTELKNFDMMGIAPNFSYGPYERRPFKRYLVHQAKKGKWVTVTPNYIELPQLLPKWEEAGLPGIKVQ